MLYDVTFDLSYKYGSLIVLNCGSQIVQFTFAFHSNALHIRTNWNNEKWTNWQTVSLTWIKTGGPVQAGATRSSRSL